MFRFFVFSRMLGIVSFL